MGVKSYVHGYSTRESLRLDDQASTLEELLHHDSAWEGGATVLEAGCGVGAQTKIIAARNPSCKFISVDISEDSIRSAHESLRGLGLTNVRFEVADIFRLPYRDESFDHVFVCFVLEHLSSPGKALGELSRVLRRGGTITVIEGDHGSACFHPDSEEARRAIGCQVELQRRSGGDATIGRRLYPLLSGAGYRDVRVSPRMVYVDGSRPHLIEGFTKNTFTAMIEGVREQVRVHGLMASEEFEKGIAGLYRTAEVDGVFCYTFFKAVGVK